MKRLLAASLLLALGCSRSARPAAHARPTTVAVQARAPAQAPRAAESPEEEAREQAQIMNAVHDLSHYPDTAEGVRSFAADLAGAAIHHDEPKTEALERELNPDDTRFELAFTFDGTHQLADRVLTAAPARREALVEHLAELREPVQVAVTSALGSELADGGAHGFDPRVASVRTLVRSQVRFYHVEVTGAGGAGRVVLEPMAFLGGRWTWLAEPWTVAAPTPGLPGAPGVAAAPTPTR